MKTINIIKYKIKVSDSALSSIHGFYHDIDEFYIPQLKIIFNVENDNLNIIRHQVEERLALALDKKEICCSYKLISVISKIIKHDDQIEINKYIVRTIIENK